MTGADVGFGRTHHGPAAADALSGTREGVDFGSGPKRGSLVVRVGAVGARAGEAASGAIHFADIELETPILTSVPRRRRSVESARACRGRRHETSDSTTSCERRAAQDRSAGQPGGAREIDGHSARCDASSLDGSYQVSGRFAGPAGSRRRPLRIEKVGPSEPRCDCRWTQAGIGRRSNSMRVQTDPRRRRQGSEASWVRDLGRSSRRRGRANALASGRTHDRRSRPATIDKVNSGLRTRRARAERRWVGNADVWLAGPPRRPIEGEAGQYRRPAAPQGRGRRRAGARLAFLPAPSSRRSRGRRSR